MKLKYARYAWEVSSLSPLVSTLVQAALVQHGGRGVRSEEGRPSKRPPHRTKTHVNKSKEISFFKDHYTNCLIGTLVLNTQWLTISNRLLAVQWFGFFF